MKVFWSEYIANYFVAFKHDGWTYRPERPEWMTSSHGIWLSFLREGRYFTFDKAAR